MTDIRDTIEKARSLSWVSTAELRTTHEEGSYSKGKSRVLVDQRITMCAEDHPRWRVRGQTHTVCGTCHPPAIPAEQVEWL